MHKFITFITILTIASLHLASPDVSYAEEVDNNYRTITDMQGRLVQIPANLEHVVTLDDGFVAGVMTVLQVQKKIIALGSHCPVKNFSYTFSKVDGEQYTYVDGRNPVSYLNPWLSDVPYMATYKQSTNFEELAKLEPDVVFMRVGSCYSCSDGSNEVLQRQIRLIEAMDIPLVILNGPPAYENPSVEHITEEILLVGEVFDVKNKSLELANYLESIVSLIKSRTAKISEEDKPSTLLFGLSPKARGQGAAGTAQGKDTIEALFIKDIINAKNAYQGIGSFSIINIEHIFSMDPDVIILPTAWGYHPPSELYTAPYYKNLSGLKAVKNRRVVALPWTPCNCAKRIEYPIELMILAKACYPELFSDIMINEWVLEFYQKVYGVDEDVAKGLRSAQWLDWTVEEQW